MIQTILPDRSECDVLVGGDGLAGSTVALKLADGGKKVVLLSGAPNFAEHSASRLAAGGIIFKGDGDGDLLVRDVFVSGREAGFMPAIEQLAVLGPEAVRELLIDGAMVPFDREKDGEASAEGLSLTREGGHSNRRIIHVGDATGAAIMKALKKRVLEHPNIAFVSEHLLMDLLTTGHQTTDFSLKYQKNRCLGGYVLDARTQAVRTLLAKHTVLATGGIGQLYSNTVNNLGATGSGWAVSVSAGVRNLNTRFVQFHPTAFKPPGSKSGERMHLVTEAVRGEGGRLKTKDGRFLMDGYPKKDLEGRDVVSQAIFQHLKETGDECVYLDIASFYTGSVPLQERFPSIYQACLEHNIDITREPIPVAPAAHFAFGGIVTDLHGKTELDGLYAVGEVACTGVHGANRLASTSLLECVVWGRQAALDILGAASPDLRFAFDSVKDWQYFPKDPSVPGDLPALRARLQQIMWEKVGIQRKRSEVIEAMKELSLLRTEVDKLYRVWPLSKELVELRHMVRAAQTIAHDAGNHMNIQMDSLGGHLLVDDGELVRSELNTVEKVFDRIVRLQGKKIGWFGFSADPITLAHEQLIRQALMQQLVDTVVVFVSGRQVGKMYRSSDADRVAMAKLVVSGLQRELGDRVIFSTFDIEKGDGAYRWWDLWKELEVKDPETGTISKLYMGSDNWNVMQDAWYEGRRLKEEARFLLAPRAGYDLGDVIFDERVELLEMKPIDGSSTEAREGNLTIVRPEVKEYILENRLYRG